MQIAKRGKYAIGDVINTHKAWSEKFYVVAAGVVEARILKEDEEEGTNGEHRGSIGGSGFGGGLHDQGTFFEKIEKKRRSGTRMEHCSYCYSDFY